MAPVNLYPRTAADALASLRSQRALLGRTDPRAVFVDVYTLITAEVAGRLASGRHDFAQPEWIERLTAQFATSALIAVDDAVTGALQYGPWLPALDLGIEVPPYVRALLGMNAHINHDLARVVCADLLDVAPNAIPRYRRDYFEVMSLLAVVLPDCLELLVRTYRCPLTAMVYTVKPWRRKATAAVWWLIWNWRSKVWGCIEDLLREDECTRWTEHLNTMDGRALDIARQLIQLRGPLYPLRAMRWPPTR
jgi:hypothetical protein